MPGAKVQIERHATTEYVIVAFKFDSKDKADFALAASGRKKGSPPSSPPPTRAMVLSGPAVSLAALRFCLSRSRWVEMVASKIKETMISQLI